MELTEAQKEINPSEIYWHWFSAWWDKDFSFESVCAGDVYTGRALSAYSHCLTNKLVPFGGRTWHPIHLPPHDLNGNLASNELDISRRDGQQLLTHGVTSDGVLRRDIGRNYARGVSKISWHPIDNQAIQRLSRQFENCYITDGRLSTSTYENCFFDTEDLLATNEVKFTNCCFNHLTKIRGFAKVNILNGVNLDDLQCLDTKELAISETPLFRLQYSSSEKIVADIELTSDSMEVLFLGLHHPDGVEAEIRLSGSYGHNIHLEKLNVQSFNSVGVEHLAFSKLGALEIVDCKFANALDLRCDTIQKVYCQRSIFSHGFNLNDAKVLGVTKFKGVSIFDYADFDKSTFEHGFLCVPDRYPDGSLSESVLQNASFEGTTFIDNERSRKSSCVNFNDSKFISSASFNRAVFDGVPKFHGTTLHSETSFMDLGPIPEIDGEIKTTSERYGAYQSAFRSLRQHMENNHSSAMAFEFGRREMISKQRRTEYVDVPKREVQLTKLYGRVADYGQNFMRPLKWLFGVFCLSFSLQCGVFLLTASKCHSVSSHCKIDWNLAGEAFERSAIFSIPPFTMLTNRSVDSKDMPPIDWYTDILSAAVMFAHGILASTLVFLFLLGIRRRMQIK